MGWLANTHEGALFESSLWYYHVDDNLQIIYGDISHSGQFANGIEYNLAVQADWGEDIGKGNMGNIEAKTWGATASITYQKLTTTLAYNKNESDSGALPSLGGGPFFTSMEDQTLDAVAGERAEATLLALGYAVTDNLILGSTFGQFNAKNKSDYDVDEVNFYLTYNWKEQTSFGITYAQLNDKNVPGKDHQLRAILSYSY
jgi:hypothetical protein